MIEEKPAILIISYACEPHRGSEEGCGWYWPYYLAKSGFEVKVITRSLGREAIEKELNNHNFLNIEFFFIDVFNYKRRNNFPSIKIYLESFLWQIKALNYIKRSSIHYDLVHHVTWTGIFIGSMFWKLRKPFIFGPFGGGQITSQKFLSLFGDGWRKERIRNWATRNYPMTSPTGSFLRHTDLTFVTNEETAAAAKKAGAKKIEYFLDSGLPDDFYPKEFPIRNPANSLRVFWAGSLLPRKGLALALKAIKECKFPLSFTIAGDGPLRGELEAMAEELDLHCEIKWLGKVPWADMKKLYAENDVFLFTSIRDSFGGQVLEAMACGMPVIALNQGGVKTMVPSNTIIKINCEHPEIIYKEISNQLNRLWVDTILRNQIGRNAYEFSKSESWSERVHKMEEFYEQILKIKDQA